MSCHLDPGELLVNGPTARIDHGSAGGVEEVAELTIAHVHRLRIDVAAVQFDVVDAPLGESGRVDVHVADDARIALARPTAVTLINTETQTV